MTDLTGAELDFAEARPCPVCGASEYDDMPDYKQPSVLRDVPSTASAHTDYHELPEVPRCCGTCVHLVTDCVPIDAGWQAVHECDVLYLPVELHGLCSHWERRDDGG